MLQTFYKQNIYINLKNAFVLSDYMFRISDLLTKLLNSFKNTLANDQI